MDISTWQDRNLIRDPDGRVIGIHTLASWAACTFGGGGVAREMPAEGLDLSVKAVARVNWGRWIVDCPWGCGGAEYLNPEDLRFFCTECRNAAVGNSPVLVDLPVTFDDVNAALVNRPTENRNWVPDETPGDLLRENTERGVPA